mgnify:CR=1 FL=1
MGKDKKGKKTAPASELSVLSPDAVEWVIGEKLFYQQPLPLKRLSAVMTDITDVLLSGGRGGLILDQIVDAIGEGGLKGQARQAVMPVIVRTVVAVPEALPRICAKILEQGDEKHLDAHLGGRQALAIIKTFIEQNEVGALLQDFFGLLGSLTESLETATEELTEEAGGSPSESQKTEEASEPE